MAYREDRSVPEAPGPDALKPETRAAEAAAPITPAAALATRKPRSRKRIVGIVVLLLALGAGCFYGYRYWTEGRFMVSTDDAYVAGDITILAAKVPGYVAAIEVQNNQRVAAGAVIARIDDVDYVLAVQSARDKVATLEATAGRIGRQIEAARAQVAQAEPLIAAARADRLRADSEFDRQTKLSQSDFASKAKFEQALADRDRAGASLKGAEAGLLVAKANVDVLQAQRSEAERTADEARTALARAQRDLDFTRIRAPVTGTVGNRAVEVGAYVQPGQRLAALVPLSTIHVDANFKETQLAHVRPGQKVYLQVDAYGGREFPATVESIAPASGSQFSLLPPENATGNFTKIVQRVPVRVRVAPEVRAEELLRPGMSVVVRVDSRDRPADQTASR